LQGLATDDDENTAGDDDNYNDNVKEAGQQHRGRPLADIDRPAVSR
jgi:hypothetical protein